MKCTVCDGSGRTPSPTGVPMIGATSCAGCFGTGCGPAPSTPGEGTGRPVPLGIEQTVATLMVVGNELLAEGRIDQASAAFVAAGYIDADAKSHAAQPPASPVPPTPTPCPYIVTGGEGTSYCSLAERSAMHAAVPPTPTPQADGTGQALKSMAIELAVERRRASLATVALLNACRDGWADGDSAAAKYLAEAELAAAPPSTPADPRPTDPTGSEA